MSQYTIREDELFMQHFPSQSQSIFVDYKNKINTILNGINAISDINEDKLKENVVIKPLKLLSEHFTFLDKKLNGSDIIIKYSIEFTGDPTLFRYHCSSYYTRGYSELDILTIEENRLVIQYTNVNDEKSRETTNTGILKRIQDGIAEQITSIDNYNTSMSNAISELVQNRIKRINEFNAI